MIVSVRCRRTVRCGPRRAMGFRSPAASPSQGFHSPAASESLLFACPKRSNQEKGHPDVAVSGHPALRLRERAPGFDDSPSLDWRRTGRDPSRPPCGPFSAHSPRHRGPIEARILRAQAGPCAAFALALALDPSSARRMRALCFEWGPCGRAEERSRQPGKGKLFEHRDVRVVCRPVAGEHRRGPGGQESDRRGRRGVLSFGYFPLDTQRKVTRSPQASESPYRRPLQANESPGLGSPQASESPNPHRPQASESPNLHRLQASESSDRRPLQASESPGLGSPPTSEGFAFVDADRAAAPGCSRAAAGRRA